MRTAPACRHGPRARPPSPDPHQPGSDTTRGSLRGRQDDLNRAEKQAEEARCDFILRLLGCIHRSTIARIVCPPRQPVVGPDVSRTMSVVGRRLKRGRQAIGGALCVRLGTSVSAKWSDRPARIVLMPSSPYADGFTGGSARGGRWRSGHRQAGRSGRSLLDSRGELPSWTATGHPKWPRALLTFARRFRSTLGKHSASGHPHRARAKSSRGCGTHPCWLVPASSSTRSSASTLRNCSRHSPDKSLDA